jgi:phosphopantothenoylcysteine decarboxylase / phosphopantothenate---cysteine ligase
LIVAIGRPIVLGISGGIAAYKTPLLIRLLQKNGFAIKAVCTPAALTLVAKQTLRTITGNPVYIDNQQNDTSMDHIELAQWGEVLLICPATANTIAKIAHGIADNLLTSLALSFQNRLIVAPAMNTAMWTNEATQDNLAILRRRNVSVLPVDEGELACGDSGPGRLLPLEAIVEHVLSRSVPRCLADKKVLIASGPTCEPIDAVRVITNRSSGKMGSALAAAALAAGARVTVVTGPAAAPLPAGARVVHVLTALEMKDALEKEFIDADVCIMAAAISDYRPKNPSSQKKQCDRDRDWDLTLVPNPDIAEGLGHKKNRQFLVGFSLETDDGLTRPILKMKKKNCDMMVVNRVDSSLERDQATVTLLFPDKPPMPLPLSGKRQIAAQIMEHIAQEGHIAHG